MILDIPELRGYLEGHKILKQEGSQKNNYFNPFLFLMKAFRHREVKCIYIKSLKTFSIDFDYCHSKTKFSLKRV